MAEADDHPHEVGAQEHEAPPRRNTPSDPDGVTHISLNVPDMDCPSCAGKVTRSVESIEGTVDVTGHPTTGRLDVTFDPERTETTQITDAVEAAGYTVETPTDARAETLDVPEMDCPSCAGKVENAIRELPGVVDYDLQPTTGRVDLTYNPATGNLDDIIDAIESAGYRVTNAETAGEVTGTEESAAGLEAGPSDVWRSTRAKKTWLSGAFLLLGVLIEFAFTGLNTPLVAYAGREILVADALLLAGVVAGGQVIIRNGYYSARNLNLDIDLLMAVAVLAATGASLLASGVSLYVEAASLAFLFNVAELLERYSVNRARNSIAELVSLAPDTAVVRRNGEEVEIPADEVAVGEVVLVRPGEKIPVDGTVVEGESAVNQAPITGESVPVDKDMGDEVFAGTVNEQGYLEVETTSPADESTLSRIIELVEDAQAKKTEREQFVERFSQYYTPLVVAFAILVAAIPPLLGRPWDVWFLRGISLLVIACPCAFVISTPVTVVSGVTSAARNGVLVKGGTHLEAMGDVNAVALDKTGTLTTGDLGVTDVVPLGDNTETDVLQCARGLETRSEHPIGEAIVERAEERDVSAREVSDFESITGKGVRADLDGTTHYAGKPGLFQNLGFDLTHAHVADTDVAEAVSSRCADREDCVNLVESVIPRLQAEGKTVILVGTEDELEGIVAVADAVRPEAEAAVARLKRLGVEHVVMLTGDNEGTARAVAEQVGVDEYRAELLPDEKVAAVEGLVDEYGSVAMVGDGVNDAPALATATVGVAMGAAGTDTAIETADIALMSDDLSKLPYLYDLASQAGGVIRQNVWGSLAVKALLAIGIPLGYVSVVVAILAGDVGMTTLVTGNALRLGKVRPEDPES